MNSFWSRFLITSCFSAFIAGGTYYWDYTHRDLSSGSSSPIVAYITVLQNEVHRRPQTRLLWQNLKAGEAVRSGEIVRTSENAVARIQFQGTDRYLDLEAESMVAFKQASTSEISLDLLNGSLFVAEAKDAGANAHGGLSLTLQSDKGTVDLTQASAQISKSQGAAVDIQVLKGAALLKDKGSTQKITSDKPLSQFEILSPALGKKIFLHPDKPDPLLFAWKSSSEQHASKKTTFQVLVSTTRSLKSPQIFTTEKTSTSIPLSAGTHFWRVEQLDAQKKVVSQSGVFKLDLESRQKTFLLKPDNQVSLAGNLHGGLVNFSWASPAEAEKLKFEVAKDPDFTDRLFSKDLKISTAQAQESLPVGTYYWRILASYSDLKSPVGSETRRFEVKNTEKPRGILSWNNTQKEVQLFIGRPSFSVAWTNSLTPSEFKYQLSWAKTPEELTSTNVQSQKTKQLLWTQEVPEAGPLFIQAKAFDQDGDLRAESEILEMTLSPRPLLSAPTFIPQDGEMMATSKGQLDLNWSAVREAKNYTLILLDSTGKELRRAQFQRNQTRLMNLLPGEYKVQVEAIDQFGRTSERKPARTVRVPASSDIEAPKMKRIKVD